MSTPIYAIDLGTTFTKCGLVRPEDGVLRIFKLDADQRGSPVNTLELLRSAVAVTTEDERRVAYVGSQAWTRFTDWDPDMDGPFRRFEESKLWIGEIAADDGEAPPWTFPAHGWGYRPEDIGALVMRKVKREIERDRAPPMRRVVVTHPQFFTEARREATRQAAKLADLEIVDTITEPDAAAIAFGRDASPGTYMVFDLGGGTLDITIVRLGRDGRTEVVTSDGERKGGRDWDRTIVSRMIELYQQKFPTFSADYLDEITLQDWMRKAEQIKWQLTGDQAADPLAGERIQCNNNVFSGMRVQFRIRLSEFESATQEHVDASKRCVARSLANKGMTWRDIDGVLLVGGSTRLRAIREMLARESGKQLNTRVDANTAVVQGAAIYAHRLAQKDRPIISIPSAPSGIALVPEHTGALARGLGVRAFDPSKGAAGEYVIVNLIPKDSPLPISRTKRFGTEAPNQTKLDVELWEGESADPEQCERLGICTLTDLPPGPPGQPVDVTIDLHANGSKQFTVIAGVKCKRESIRFDAQRVLPDDVLAERAVFLRSIEVR